MVLRDPRIAIVDDDAELRPLLAGILKTAGFDACLFSSGDEFLKSGGPHSFSLVVTDLQMPGLNGLDLQTALAQSSNPLPLLFLTGHGDIASTVHAMRGGAEDFLEKRAPKEALLDAVTRALARDARERSARIRQRELRVRFDSLSERELQVLAHVVQGRLNKQIAGDLGIHERTVKLHRTAITSKLGVPSVAALTRLTQEAGIFAAPAPTFPKGQ